jgi:hypothetical protein
MGSPESVPLEYGFDGCAQRLVDEPRAPKARVGSIDLLGGTAGCASGQRIGNLR